MSRAAIVLVVCAGLAASAVAPGGCAHAQDGAESVSARDRRAAAEAYDRGSAAYLAEEFEDAARWFETAHRLAPAAAALVQATRSHLRAGNELRAATLALRLQALYPDDRAAARTATRALAAAGRFVRVDVTCDADCTLEVAGAIMGHHSFFLPPDQEHEVVAEFATGRRSASVSGRAGETVTLSFEAPPPLSHPEPVDARPAEAPASSDEPSDDAGGDGVPLAVTVTAMVVTAGLGGVLIWSGIDTLDGVPAFEADPTVERLQDGRAREERTNWLIAATSVAGAATVLLMIFTDWNGDGDADDDEPGAAEVRASVDLQPGRALVGLTGRF